MKRFWKDWRTWTGLLTVSLLAAILTTTPARANSLLKALTSLMLGDGADGQSMQQQLPQIPTVDVAGQGAVGGVQLVDMTAQYEKTDLVIQTSIGPLAFTRVFRTNPTTYELLPFNSKYLLRPQWRWKGLNGYAWYDSSGGGMSMYPTPCDTTGNNHQLPECTYARHADFVVEDPDTGALLTYYTRAGNASGAVLTGGFQKPADNENSAKLYIILNAQGTGVSEFVLFKDNVHYYFSFGTNPSYLTTVEDTRYRTLATINYISTPGVISNVITADGVEAVFNYTSGALNSITLDSSGATVATYTTNADGGFAQVLYNETGAGEKYAYGANTGPYNTAFSVTSLTGQAIVSYVVDAGPYGSGPNGTGGNGAVSSQTTEETTLALQGWYYTPTEQSCPPSGSQWCTTPRTVTDPSATSGDGNLSAATLTAVYKLTYKNSDPQTSGVSFSYPPGADAGWQYAEGILDPPVPGQGIPVLPIAEWHVNGNGYYTVYPDAGYTSSPSVPTGAGFMLPVEYPTVLGGAVSATGAGAPSVQSNGYEYGGVGQNIQGYEQLLKSTQESSPLGGNLVTYYNWDTTNNRLNSVVMSGQTAINSSFSLVAMNRGVIYKYDGTTSTAHLIEVDGPCFVTGPVTTPACNTSYTVPVVQYAYYGASPVSSAGHLMKKTVLNGATNLVTTYDSYDGRGRVTQSTDPNGVVTTWTYAGDHLQSMQVGTDITSYGYDGDQLLWVKNPTGMYDVTCHRVGTSDPACATGGTPSKFVQWKARCTGPTCPTLIAKVVYFYTHGFAYRETYYDATNQVRRVVQHDRDPRNRPTWDALGNAAYTPNATTRLFDANGNQTAVGFPYNAPPPFCNQGTNVTGCAELTYDGLDRLSNLAEPDIVPQGQGQLTIHYDSLGHVSNIVYNGQSTTYQYDDFGNLFSVSAPYYPSGGTKQYAYDAQGHIIAKRSPAMAAGEFLQYDYDSAGRPLDLKHYLGGYTTLWALAYDASAVPPANCPAAGKASFTNGRVQVRTDSFGQTWYTYNFRGQVTGEIRVRSGSTACAPLPTSFCQQQTSETNPNTAYGYSSAGQLSTVFYPHGRTVGLSYGADGDQDRVSQVTVGLNVAGTCNGYGLLTNITWEPFGGLRGYQINAPTNISSASASVEYLLGDNSSVSTMTSCSSPPRPSGSTSDQTGRLRALWVSTGSYSPYSPTGTGNIFARQYSWQGDQLTSQATCLLQTGGIPTTENFTYDARLELAQASRGSSGERKVAGGAWGQRSYGYDLRGNRGSGGTVDQTDCWGWTDTYANDLLMNRAVTSNTCTGTSLPYLATAYGYDSDGRVTSMTAPSDSSGSSSLNLSLNATIDAQAAVDAVYKYISVNGSTYEYYYDANGRRRLKLYPTGDEDEYFYDVNSQMLEEHDEHGSDTPATYTLDQYIWLDGRPLILLRSSTNAAGAPNPDFSGTCADFGACGVFFPITDYLKKPVLLLDSSLLVAGAADYDPFGQVNRVMGAGDTLHPYPASPVNSTGAPEAQEIAGFRQNVQPEAAYLVVARARLAMVDTDSSATAYASLTDLKVNTLASYPSGSGSVGTVGGPHSGAQVTGWAFVPNTNAPFPWQFQVRFTAASATSASRPGISVLGYEYRKYQTGSTPTWLPIRFPGQYYDAETDLVQNWNRFYDLQTGRYLAPDAIWLYPERLVTRALTGRSAPVYAYTGNNPIGMTDSDGLAPCDSLTCYKDTDALTADWMNGSLDGTLLAQGVIPVRTGTAGYEIPQNYQTYSLPSDLSLSSELNVTLAGKAFVSGFDFSLISQKFTYYLADSNSPQGGLNISWNILNVNLTYGEPSGLTGSVAGSVGLAGGGYSFTRSSSTFSFGISLTPLEVVGVGVGLSVNTLRTRTSSPPPPQETQTIVEPQR